MTHSTIAAELLKQLDQLPLEYQKKVLEFAKVLNITALEGKPGKDLLKLAGTIDQDSLKAKEETVEYGCERMDTMQGMLKRYHGFLPRLFIKKTIYMSRNARKQARLVKVQQLKRPFPI